MFIKGISFWSFTPGPDGPRPFAEVFAQAKQAGFESVEVTLDSPEQIRAMTEKDAQNILRDADSAGIKVSSLASGLFWSKSPSASDTATRAEGMQLAEKLIDIASWMEAGALLFIPGSVDVFFIPDAEVLDPETAWVRSTRVVKSLLPKAESAKVALAIENVWNKFLIEPRQMMEFVDQFSSDWVGAYFDVGNCMNVGYPEHWIRMLGKRIKRVHLKDFRRSVGTADGMMDLLGGDVNWPEVIKALKEIGYGGYMTAELAPYRYYPEVLLENTSRAMDAILER